MRIDPWSLIKHGDTIALRHYLVDGGQAGAVNANGVSLLMAAAASGHTPILRLLLDAGADVHETWPGGWTPLARAALSGTAEAVSLLLQRGADATVPIQNAPGGSLLSLIRQQTPDRTGIISLLEHAEHGPSRASNRRDR